MRGIAGADLDGYPYGAVVQTGLYQPFLFFWSEPPSAADPAWQKARQDTRLIFDRLPPGAFPDARPPPGMLLPDTTPPGMGPVGRRPAGAFSIVNRAGEALWIEWGSLGDLDDAFERIVKAFAVVGREEGVGNNG